MHASVTHLKPVWDFRQSGDCRLLVYKLMPIKIAKLAAIQTNTEVRTKHAFSLLNNTTPSRCNTANAYIHILNTLREILCQHINKNLWYTKTFNKLRPKNLQTTNWLPDWVKVFTSHSTQNKSFQRRSTEPRLGMEKTKPNTKACIHQSKELYYNTKWTQQTKARLSRLLRHLVWKRIGPFLILVLHKFVTHLLT